MITPTDLKVLPVFDTFTSSQLKAVGDRGELQELSPEETVFRHNDPAGMLYGLLEGQVELTFVYKDKLLETDIKRLHWRTERLVENWVEAFGTDRVS